MSLKSSIATGVGRAVSWGLKNIAHRDASHLPGRIAMAIDPDVTSALAGKLRRGGIVVCGTNGKTTTNNVIASAIERTGSVVLCNRIGANMAPGVAAAMLPGRTADWAVMEADELSTIHILPQLKPSYLVLLNLFRDQLDRAGEIDHVQDTIVAALEASPTTALLVNGDDPISYYVGVRASESCGTKVLAFGMGEDLALAADRVPEARFCQRCGAELSYSQRSYAQLGAFSCPECGFARPELDYVATNVKVGREGVSFDVGGAALGGKQVHLSASFGGAYMAYNLLAAFAAAHLAGVDGAAFQATLDDYHPENGRLQRFEIGGREVILNLAKNPTGFNQNIVMLQADERPKAIYFAVNDLVNDGHDISWIWDVDFERLAGDGLAKRVLAGGLRANDVQVRMKYAGLQAECASTIGEVLGRLGDLPADVPLYALCNYSALFPAKAELEKMVR